MKRLLLLTTLIAFVLIKGFCQNISIENVYKIELRNSDAIREGSEVKGYYFFYVSDKIDKKTDEYTLRIFDNNLKKLKDIKFEDSKEVSIMESSFNGKDLIFLFYNSKERTLEYQIFGVNGSKKRTYSRELTKKEKAFFEATYMGNDEESSFKGLYPVEGKGFISNTPSREGKDYTFELDFFSAEKNKQWAYIPTEGSKRCLGDYLGCYNGVVFVEVLKYKSMLDQKPDSYIVGLNLENGQQIFEIETQNNGKLFHPYSLSVLNGKAYFFGQYFKSGDNVMNDKSLGFGFWQLDTKGKLINENYCSWENDLGKYLDVTSKGVIADFGNLFLHDIFQTADGKVFAIGEGFKKVVSALGIASKIFAAGIDGSAGGLVRAHSNIGLLKVKVTDLLLIEFDSTLNVKGAQIYPKSSNNIELRSGMEFISAPIMGKLIKYAFGEFDYRYTQFNTDMSSFSICYSDFVKEKKYKGGTYNSISYYDGKISTDRINTKSDATRSYVLPGKQGQVLIIEYYKKDKKLEAHFEKLN